MRASLMNSYALLTLYPGSVCSSLVEKTTDFCYLHRLNKISKVSMKRVRTKKDIQADLEAQVANFLHDGGEIDVVDRGQSGLPHDKPWINPFKSAESEKSQERTPVPEVLAAIDARKKSKRKPPTKRKKPEKVWILDDFGEPIRWVWSDEA